MYLELRRLETFFDHIEDLLLPLGEIFRSLDGLCCFGGVCAIGGDSARYPRDRMLYLQEGRCRQSLRAGESG